MNGTFNGLPLKKITALKTTTEASGFSRTAFRIIGRSSPKLEALLELGAWARLAVSSQEIEGWIVHYTADVHTGYEITIEWKWKRNG